MTTHAGRTPVDSTPSNCHPTTVMPETCSECIRWRRGPTPPPGKHVVIDASLVVKDGHCPMFIARGASLRAQTISEVRNAA